MNIKVYGLLVGLLVMQISIFCAGVSFDYVHRDRLDSDYFKTRIPILEKERKALSLAIKKRECFLRLASCFLSSETKRWHEGCITDHIQQRSLKQRWINLYKTNLYIRNEL